MDPQLYKNEIDRLSKEIHSLKEDTTEKPPFNILNYKYYFLIVFGLGLVIYMVKPKCILTVHIEEAESEDEEDNDTLSEESKNIKAEIVVSKKYFFLCWIMASLICCTGYYIFSLYKKH